MSIKLDDDLFPADNGVPRHARLLAAVLRRACVDWVLYKSHKSSKMRRHGKDAELWIFGSSSEEVNSFNYVCEILDLKPESIRTKIRNMDEDTTRRLRGMEFGDEW